MFFFRAVALVAGTLGLCGATEAQSQVRVGVSASVPIHIHSISSGDKGVVNGFLMLVVALVVMAVAAVCLMFFYGLLAVVWESIIGRFRSWRWQDRDLMPYLPPQERRSSDPKQRKIEIEQAQIRKREWEKRMAQVRRENAEG
jgi:hypothetical protein